MLSRLLTAARNILSSQSENTDVSENQTAGDHVDSEMVTTRRQSGHKAAAGTERASSPLEDQIPKELLDTESRKRRRQLNSEYAERSGGTPVSAMKRQRKNKSSEASVPTETHTHSVTEMSVASLVGNKEAEDKSASNSITVEEVEEPEVTTKKAKTPVKKSTPRKSPKTKVLAEENITPVAEPIPKPKHKRFGSEEPIEEPLPVLERKVEVADSDGESSDDDDAPEEVTADAAEENARKTAREAAKAAEL